MMNIEEIRKRHESNDLWIEADTDGWQAHKDRGVLLERVAELEADIKEAMEWKMIECNEHIGWTEASAACPRCLIEYHKADAAKLRQRIAELEHQSAGCTCPTVAQLRRPEVCPKCNQEMGNPHHCRPNWSGESIKGD
jgi:hypothetical protein